MSDYETRVEGDKYPIFISDGTEQSKLQSKIDFLIYLVMDLEEKVFRLSLEHKRAHNLRVLKFKKKK